MIRFSIALILLVTLFSCSTTESEVPDTSLKNGMWRGILSIQGQKLPFIFDVGGEAGNQRIHIINAGERLLLDDISFRNDSVVIPLHIFDAAIVAKIHDDKLNGTFIKYYDRKADVPFTAVAGTAKRFEVPQGNTPTGDFSGKYSVRFFGKDTTDAVGIFNQHGDSVTGTFLTKTGDYRFLEGNVIGDSLHLSTFDGNHVYLFVAGKNENEISGTYFSGKTVRKAWVAKRDDHARLPDATSVTFLKEGYSRFEFSFPDADGNIVTSADPVFKGKVVIIQLMGTWCPNCMDETNFLVPWYQQNKDRGVEIVALAFERKDDFAYASERVRKMMEKLDVNYPVLIAGVNDKEKAAQALPMLGQFVAWPTTIYVGKDGNVKKIYTGFSGPGTGAAFDEFKQEFNETVNTLLTEKPSLSKISKK